MLISFSPIRDDEWSLEASVTGDVITINGEAFDFSSLPDGATIPEGTVPTDFIVGPVERADGELRLTLLLPHGPDPKHSVAFPVPVTVTSGRVPLPTDEA